MKSSKFPTFTPLALAALLLSSCRTNDLDAYLKKYPDTPKEVVAGLKSGIVVIGMTPVEAKAAGGALFYEVTPDEKWPPDTNPLAVMAAQKDSPDRSRITLHFKNKRQFSTRVPVVFTVYFENGRATRIERN